MKDDIDLCYVHGECKRCSYLNCNNLNRKGGLCVRHGSTKKTCTTHGCNKNAVKGGVCIAHGAKRACMIMGCDRSLFKEKKCRFHYRCFLGHFRSEWDPSITTVHHRPAGILGFFRGKLIPRFFVPANANGKPYAKNN